MKTAIAFILLWATIIIGSIAGMITHIVVCLQDQNWILLIAGAIAAPIGIIHGIGHWFGFW